MASVILRSHVGRDGVLKLTVPESMREKNVQVVLSVDDVGMNAEVERDALGWPKGYFERTFGSCKEFGLQRPEQPAIEPVEPLDLE